MSNGFNLEKTLRRIDEKLSKIAIDNHQQHRNDDKSETWVKVSLIKKLTGWNKYQLREARRNGWVKMRWNEDGISYHLESLNPIFIVNKNEGLNG